VSTPLIVLGLSDTTQAVLNGAVLKIGLVLVALVIVSVMSAAGAPKRRAAQARHEAIAPESRVTRLSPDRVYEIAEASIAHRNARRAVDRLSLAIGDPGQGTWITVSASTVPAGCLVIFEPAANGNARGGEEQVASARRCLFSALDAAESRG